VEVHPQLSNNVHPVDNALVGAGSCGPALQGTKQLAWFKTNQNLDKL
jgi:hypothetical protein